MTEKYNYYREEMRRVLPIDRYGISIQIRTSTGSTKWLALNPESFQVLLEVFEKQVSPEFPEPDNNELMEAG